MKKQNAVLLALFAGSLSPAIAWVSPSSLSSTVMTRDHAMLLRAKNNKKDEDEFKKLQHQDESFEDNSSKHAPFAKGTELKQIRDELRNLRESLMWAVAMHDEDRVHGLSKLVQSHEQRDPEHVYAQTLAEIAQVQAKFDCDPVEKAQQIQTLKTKAKSLRSQLPRFQMEGLWVGSYVSCICTIVWRRVPHYSFCLSSLLVLTRSFFLSSFLSPSSYSRYGENDLQLVNITYRGDTLVATKTTGDTNVPRGQTSFTADFSPPRHTNDTAVTRYQGQGQVAQNGFVQHKYVNGHLLLQEDSIYTSDTGCYDRFSFVWYAERQHKVVFQRPLPHQTLNLLRDTLSREDELENMRTHLTRCLDLDATDALARLHAGKLLEEDDEPFRRIKRLKELEDEQQQEDKERVPKKEWGGQWKRYLSEGIWKNILNRKKENTWDDFLEMGF